MQRPRRIRRHELDDGVLTRAALVVAVRAGEIEDARQLLLIRARRQMEIDEAGTAISTLLMSSLEGRHPRSLAPAAEDCAAPALPTAMLRWSRSRHEPRLSCAPRRRSDAGYRRAIIRGQGSERGLHQAFNLVFHSGFEMGNALSESM